MSGLTKHKSEIITEQGNKLHNPVKNDILNKETKEPTIFLIPQET